MMKADKACFSYHCDAIAIDPRASSHLALLSASGSQSAIKALKAVIAQPKVYFSLQLGEFTGAPYINTIQSSQRDDAGYHYYTHHLGFNFWQLLVVTKRPTVLASMDEESVWQRLRSSSYTTPIMRDWMPWVMRQLKLDKHMIEAKCWQCRVGVLMLTQPNFDNMICAGLRNQELIIN